MTAKGLIEGCEVTGGGGIGIQIGEGGDPTIRDTWVHDRGGPAVNLKRGACGVIERCRFENNAEGVSKERSLRSRTRVKTTLKDNVVG